VADAKPVSLAPEKPAKKESNKPEIQYFGDGADKVKFEIDPKAKLIRVYGNGVVLTDY
jgi:hypothetical protein